MTMILVQFKKPLLPAAITDEQQSSPSKAAEETEPKPAGESEST